MGVSQVAGPGQPAVTQPSSGWGDSSPGELTKAFRALKEETGASIGRSRSSDATHVESVSVPGSSRARRGSGDVSAEDASPEEPGSFTQQFLAGLDRQSGKTKADNTLPAASEPDGSSISMEDVRLHSKPPREPGRTSPEGRFSSLFRSSPLQQGGGSRSPDDASKADAGKTGEFTRFFRGPFTGESPVEVPDTLPERPPQKGPGEFTVIFGPPKQSLTSEPPLAGSPLSDAPPREETGAFTRLFSASEQPEKTSPTAQLPCEPKATTEAAGAFPAVREPVWTPAGPPPAKLSADYRAPAQPAPIDTGVPRENQPLFSSRSKEESATRVFSPSGADVEVRQPPLQSGPSAYTILISGGAKGSTAPEEPPIASGSPKPAAQFPGVPSPPAIAPPPIPAPPALKFPPQAKPPAPPSIPKIEPPKWPQAPQPPEVPKAPVSYWPLVLIMNGLFIIAVLLVLYFALKH